MLGFKTFGYRIADVVILAQCQASLADDEPAPSSLPAR
jgi:hypothetical protein